MDIGVECEVDSLAPALLFSIDWIGPLPDHNEDAFRLTASSLGSPRRSVGADRVAACRRFTAAHAILKDIGARALRCEPQSKSPKNIVP
jgi:hypothetical protein